MSEFVIDTNVILVANGRHTAVSPDCIEECAKRLQEIMRAGKLVLDDRYRILNEYQNKTTPRRGNGPGDAFVKWALQNNANPTRVDMVALEDHIDRGFESFPHDAELESFDQPDRKFVAVANAHDSKPHILQATDSKWLGWATALNRHGITVEFICREDIERFHAKKTGP